jgi:hypothetical protein
MGDKLNGAEMNEIQRGEPPDFKSFLETQYSQTILDTELDFRMFKPYKPTIGPYLYRMLKQLFTGFDYNNPVPITLPYRFFYELTPELIEDLRRKIEGGEITESKTNTEIANNRLYLIYKYEGAYDGFSEDSEDDDLYYFKELIKACLFCKFCDDNYESEIDSNPLGFPREIDKLKNSTTLCSYHSSIEKDKIKKMDESKEEFEMVGQHFMMSPLGTKCYTFKDNIYLVTALTVIFLNGEKPLTREVKEDIRSEYFHTFLNMSSLYSDTADQREFHVPDTTPTHSQQEIINSVVKQTRDEGEKLLSISKISDLAYKQVKKSVAVSKTYYGSHQGQSPYMWGTFSYPDFDESFLIYLNPCLPSPIETKEEYDELVEQSISLYDKNIFCPFKLQKKYGDTRISFTYEIFKHFVREYGDEQIQKLFYCLFCNRTAGDRYKILNDYMLTSKISHGFLSLVYKNYKAVDTSCNHDPDNPDVPPSDYLVFTEDSQKLSGEGFEREEEEVEEGFEREEGYEEEAALVEEEAAVEEAAVEEEAVEEEAVEEEGETSPPPLKKIKSGEGGTRKRKKRNKKNKKTQKFKKRNKKTKKNKKRTKKPKNTKKMK